MINAIKSLTRKSVVAFGWSVRVALLVVSPTQAMTAPLDVKPLVTGTAHQAYFSVAVSGRHGVAVGEWGAVATSDDGGKTWTTTHVPTRLALLGVAVAGSHEIAVGQEGLILLREGKGGWRQIASGTKERLLSVSVNTQGQAVVGGAFGTVLYSADWGQHWRKIAPSWAQPTGQLNFQPHIYAVHIDVGGVITIAGELGLILRSHDGGEHWQVLHRSESDEPGSDASIAALDLRSDGTGYAVGQQGTVLRTDDGGETWTRSQTGTHANLLGVCALDDGTVYVTGMYALLVSHDRGVTWQAADNTDATSSWYEGVAALPEKQAAAVAVGHSGRIIRVAG